MEQTFKINKQLLILEATSMLEEAKHNQKTGAGSTLTDVTHSGKSDSALFNSASEKTVDDKKDITDENKEEKKEINTRMVD